MLASGVSGEIRIRGQLARLSGAPLIGPYSVVPLFPCLFLLGRRRGERGNPIRDEQGRLTFFYTHLAASSDASNFKGLFCVGMIMVRYRTCIEL
jgi:hypothetical protein